MTTSRNEEAASTAAHATSTEATAAEQPATPGEPEEPAEKTAPKPAAKTSTATTATAEPEAEANTAETAAEAPEANTAEAEARTKTEAEAASDAEAEATASMTATTTTEDPERTGRPNKALLAGAAIAGALLVTIPFLVNVGGSGDDGKRSAGGEVPGTLLGSGNGDVPGAFASAAPSPRKPGDKQGLGGNEDGRGKGGAPSTDGENGSTPLNEGGSTPLDEGGGTAGGTRTQKSGDNTTTKAGKTTTSDTGTSRPAGSTSGGASGGSGTTEKTTPPSSTVYSGVAGPGCATPSGGGYQQEGYFSEGDAGWLTQSSGGSASGGCNGRYVAVPMSGSTTEDAKSRVRWWWTPGTRARSCQISVYIPNGSTKLVGGHPTKYHVLVNANDRSTMYSSFTINQVAHRGQWVNAGTFAMKGATIGVKMLDRGDDWSKGWEKAHHAAAQIKVTCNS
ncbi:hypothetical protein [Streptomyces sp. NPDC092952]|uniref:hypothetical protein n=1 Tax=Streptomyces sp. NPDC092952 TaxID=3366018 RepID=UPI00382F9E90